MRRSGSAPVAEMAGARGAAARRRTRRGSSIALGLVAATAAAVLAGCATKRDLRDLTNEVVRLQARQDSLLAVVQYQNRELLDTLRAAGELMFRVRGDLGNQLIQMEQQLLTIQELTGQSQRKLTELRQELNLRTQEFAAPAAGEQSMVVSAPRGGDAEELYTAGMDQLQRNNPTTARRAFEQLLRDHTTHERAPDAQFQIAETFVLERQFDRALQEFDRVVVLFPNSARAPAALYRAGVISEERGNTSAARQYFQRVASGYPRSDEARLAAEKLRTLRR